MILEYGAKNYFCFKEWVSISFKLSQQCPVEISQGNGFTKILGIKGANASGKTNVLKALDFLAEFCSNSFGTKPEDEIEVRSFFSNGKPSEFYIEFECNGTLYRYEAELTNKNVRRETIFRTLKREVKIIERIGNKLKICTKEFKKLKIVSLRNNASIISTAHQYDFEELNDIYNFFSNIRTNIYLYGLHNNSPDTNILSSFFAENKLYFNFVKNLIIKYDSNINDILILDRKDKDGTDTHYFPVFVHHTSEEKKYLSLGEQSSGTQALFKQLARYKFALDSGSLLVLDEFDINLHPDILPDLLSLFLDEEYNSKNAQIIFTTHNTSILNFLGKYRSYLVNKEHGESYAYRLDEIPGDILRNDRDISRIYKSGKIGGVPLL